MTQPRQGNEGSRARSLRSPCKCCLCFCLSSIVKDYSCVSCRRRPQQSSVTTVVQSHKWGVSYAPAPSDIIWSVAALLHLPCQLSQSLRNSILPSFSPKLLPQPLLCNCCWSTFQRAVDTQHGENPLTYMSLNNQGEKRDQRDLLLSGFLVFPCN